MNTKSIIAVLNLLKNEFENANYDIAVTTSAGSKILSVNPTLALDIKAGMMVWMGSQDAWGKVVSVSGGTVTIDTLSKVDVAGKVWSFGFGLETALKVACVESGISVSAIVMWKYLDIAESLARQFPMVEITPRRSDSDYLSEDAPAIGSDGWEYHLVDITISHTGNAVGPVSTAALLYREAIRVMVTVDNTFGDLFNRIQLKGADYSAMLKLKDQQSFLQIMTQSIEVRV